jgi:diguanylate cyclase (GGDEF)-like protein
MMPRRPFNFHIADVRTRAGMIGRIVVVTAISVLLSVLLTTLLFVLLFGLDLDRMFSGYAVLRLAMIMSVLAPSIIGPIVTYRACLVTRESQLARDAFARLSLIDQLTGLPNRRGFDELALDRLAQAGAAPMAVLMLDIDSFKTFNDEFGHGFGDAALLHVANILRSATIGTSAVLGRQGGDEFAVALPGADSRAALALAERVRSACAREIVRLDGYSAQVRLSVGVASCANGQTPLTRLMSQADTALLAAKRGGRNRIVGAAGRDAKSTAA